MNIDNYSQLHNYFKNKRIWITGASKGIGRAVAKELAKYNPILVLSGRNEKALYELAHELQTETLILPFDIKDKEANFKAAKQIHVKYGGLDIAYLNAGILELLNVEEVYNNLDEEVFTKATSIFEEVVHTNLFGEFYAAMAILPLLKNSKDPQLISMSSLASYALVPEGHLAYSASKAAINFTFQGII